MDSSFSLSFGGLIPLWILGAPLLGALMSMLTTPKTQRRSDQHDSYGARDARGNRETGETRYPQPSPAALQPAGLATSRA